jgi:hypothetical protein
LVKWAVSQGQHISLVESFIAARDGDIWNDFVAVFRKGRITRKLPETFLYEHLSCTNVMTWKSSEIINPQDVSEDMLLLRGALERVQATEQSLADAVRSRDEAANSADELRSQRDALERDLQEARRTGEEIGRIRDDLAHRESELRQRQEEIEQTRAELARVRDAAEKTMSELESEASRRGHAEANANQWKLLYDRQLAQIADLRGAFEHATKEQEARLAEQLAREQESTREQIREASEKLAAVETARCQAVSDAQAKEARIGVRFQEIATLTSLLRQQQQQGDESAGHVDWLRAVHAALLSQPAWWGLMPGQWRREREQRRLQRRGLFDAQAYLARYPDVADAGLDPLFHYIAHGLQEGRSRSS